MISDLRDILNLDDLRSMRYIKPGSSERLVFELNHLENHQNTKLKADTKN